MSKKNIINDQFSLQINFKWLLQLICLVSVAVYGFWTIEGRIQALERNMVLALEEIELHEEERKHAEQKHVEQIQEQLLWYESELNLNPFSWGKGRKKKK